MGKSFPVILSVVFGLVLCVFLVELALQPRELFGGAPVNEHSYTIEIDGDLMSEIVFAYAEARETLPSRIHTEAALQDYIDTEILVREAQRRGLHHDDPAVRAILAEKMALLINAKPLPPEPPEAYLREVYEANINDFKLPSRITLRQVYVAGLNETAQQRSAEVLAALEAGTSWDELEMPVDDPPGGPVLRGRTPERLVETHGQAFIEGLMKAPPGRWLRRRSPHGYHMVTVLERREAKTISFDDARDRLANMWQNRWIRENSEEGMEALRKRYTVRGWPLGDRTNP